MTIKLFFALLFFVVCTNTMQAQTTYNVGPGQTFTNIVDVPWATLAAGDIVNIYYRDVPYQEKFGITTAGTANAPITIHGVLGPNGERPVIDGNGAVTRIGASGYNQGRGIITIGGFENHAAYIVVENLEILNAHTPYSFTNGSGAKVAYSTQSAALFIEASDNITIRNNNIHNCGNGLFVASDESNPPFSTSQDILVEQNYFYDNGVAGSIFEHNIYTESINITFQYNHIGPLLAGSRGYALKDRSANTIIRYNWIEGGRQEISLDESYDNAEGNVQTYISQDPNYDKAYIFGNVLVKTDYAIGGWADDQMIGFGGDGPNNALNPYRKGPLYIYNNTLITLMNNKTDLGAGNFDRTCVLAIAGSDVTVDMRNNIIHKTGTAALTLLNDNGDFTSTVSMTNNWVTTGYVKSMEGAAVAAEVTETGTIKGTNPGLQSLATQDYHLATGSVNIDAGTILTGDVSVIMEYVKHQLFTPRTINGILDIGAYEFAPIDCTYSISPAEISPTSSETSGTIEITAATGCAWTAISNNSWITVTSGASGTGNGTAGYSVGANTGLARTGSITIAGKTFTVNQAAINTGLADDSNGSAISVYPNPAREKVNLKFPKALSESTPYTVFNSLDIVVEEGIIPSGTRLKTLITNDYSPGMYYVKIKTSEGFVIKKIIVNH